MYPNSPTCEIVTIQSKQATVACTEYFLSNAQSNLGVFTTYAGIKGMPEITRNLKGTFIIQPVALSGFALPKSSFQDD